MKGLWTCFIISAVACTMMNTYGFSQKTFPGVSPRDFANRSFEGFALKGFSERTNEEGVDLKYAGMGCDLLLSVLDYGSQQNAEKALRSVERWAVSKSTLRFSSKEKNWYKYTFLDLSESGFASANGKMLFWLSAYCNDTSRGDAARDEFLRQMASSA